MKDQPGVPPWLRLFRAAHHSRRFQARSQRVRGLFLLWLTAVDTKGEIDLGGMGPEDFLKRYFGHDRGDRNAIRHALKVLLEHEHIVHDEASGVLRFPGYEKRQRGSRKGSASTSQRPRSDAGETSQEHRKDIATTSEGHRSDAAPPDKPPESLNTGRQIEIEIESKREKKRGADAPPLCAGARPREPGPWFPDGAERLSSLDASYVLAAVDAELGTGRSKHTEGERLANLTRFVIGEVGEEPEAVLRRVGELAAEARRRRDTAGLERPFAALCRAPGEFASRPKPAKSGRGRSVVGLTAERHQQLLEMQGGGG